MARRKAWTEAKKKKAKQALIEARDRVGLSHYSFEIVFEEEEGPTNYNGTMRTVAEVESTENYTTAIFTLYADFARMGMDDMRKHALHEWVHVIIEPLERHALQAVSPSTANLYERDLERVVEHLTKVIHYK